ncbi:MAG: hypothetical protein ACRDYA_25040 [Egibacteraceae bacterium]
MTPKDSVPYDELAEQLHSSIARLREDVEARTDPVLTEIARALELIVDIAIHAHDYALENRARIEELEAKGP